MCVCVRYVTRCYCVIFMVHLAPIKSATAITNYLSSSFDHISCNSCRNKNLPRSIAKIKLQNQSLYRATHSDAAVSIKLPIAPVCVCALVCYVFVCVRFDVTYNEYAQHITTRFCTFLSVLPISHLI